MLEIILLVAILIIVAIVAVIFSFNVISLPFTKGVPYVPLKNKNVKNILNRLDWSKEFRIVDLGCGEGRVLRMFESLGYKRLYGYEINLWPFVIGKVKNFFIRSKAKIFYKNFEKINLGQFDVIFCYLLKTYLSKLKKKFEQELKPGTKIISYAFEIEGWQPKQIFYSDEKNKKTGKIFIYEI